MWRSTKAAKEKKTHTKDRRAPVQTSVSVTIKAATNFAPAKQVRMNIHGREGGGGGGEPHPTAIVRGSECFVEHVSGYLCPCVGGPKISEIKKKQNRKNIFCTREYS